MAEEKIHFQTPKEARLKTTLRELVEKSEALLRCEITEGSCNVQALLKAIAKAKAVLEKDM